MLGKSRRHALAKPVGKPVAPRVVALMREAWWLVAVAIAIYVGMVLVTYSQTDRKSVV